MVYQRPSPVHIVAADELCKLEVSLLLLHLQHLPDLVGRVLELQLPAHEHTVDIDPFPHAPRLAYHHAETTEILLISRLSRLRYYLAMMDILLEREQYLSRIDRLYQIVSNLSTDSLIHDILLLALGHHHHGRRRRNLLNPIQSLQPREPRHILIEQDKVIVGSLAHLQSIVSIRSSIHRIPLLVEKEYMRLQQVYLVIYPKESVGHFWLFSRLYATKIKMIIRISKFYQKYYLSIPIFNNFQKWRLDDNHHYPREEVFLPLYVD